MVKKVIENMPDKTEVVRNWFSQGGQAYARFRPHYPAELAAYLASLVPDNCLAVDVGCGNGQLTQLIAEHFNAVIGLDPSADQIANARLHERITYHCASAEKMPVPGGTVNLVTAAQAAHWFNLPDFYNEVHRIAAPGCVVALISYGVLSLEPGLDERFRTFYHQEIGPWWPPERALVDAGYATLDFPFNEVAAPPLEISLEWTFNDFMGYVSTWSAVRNAQEAGHTEAVLRFADEIFRMWGGESARRCIRWPIAMRIGRV